MISPERRQEIFRIMVREEREFVLRIGWCLALAALACGVYLFYSASRYHGSSLDALSSEKGGEVELEAAFEALKDLNFFSGISRPEPLIPAGDPVLDGLSADAVMDIFVKGTAFIGNRGQADIRKRSLLSKADKGMLDSDSIREAEELGREFRLYLELRAAAFDPGLFTVEHIEACKQYAPCVSGVLQRRYPTAYNAMVLLYRYAHSQEYTERTVGYAKRNLGYFVLVREKAFAMGFPSLEADTEILGYLREVQLASVHNAKVSAVFLLVMALLFLGSAYRSRLWSDALQRGWVREER